MKKLLVGVLLLMGVFTLSACNDEVENTDPVITGQMEVTYSENDPEPNWLDLITVTDAEDGDIVLDLTNVDLTNVDMATPGTFDVVYTVVDSDGATVQHTITITIEEVVVPVFDVPNITNGDAVFATFDEYSFTRQEVWDYMILKFGLSMLLQYVEESIFADEIAALTIEEINELRDLAIFNTDNEEVIAEIMADIDLYDEFVEAYRETLLFQGYNPDVEADVRAFFGLDLAKRNYAKEFILSAGEDNTFVITDAQLESFYEELNEPNVCALTVRFYNSTEADAVFDVFNLVPNYNFGIGEYFGETPIAEVSSDLFDETNTTQLTDDEVFSKYVLLYNYMNPNGTQLPEGITKEDFCTNYPEIGTHDLEEMLEGLNYGSHPITDYIDLVFGDLRIDEEGFSRYNYKGNAINDDFIFSYKVSEEELAPFSELTTEEVAELKETYASEMVKSDAIVTEITRELFDVTGLQLVHPLLEQQYEFQNSTPLESYGDLEVVARYGDMDITADELFMYIDDRVGVNVLLTMFETEYLLDSVHFEELYGENRDFMNSTNATILGYLADFEELKLNFIRGSYISYGFDPANMTIEEFFINGFTESSEEDVILNAFLLPNLQLNYALGDLPAYEDILPFLTKQYEEYYSLNAEHIILFLDQDSDFYPDDYSDFVDGLTEEELTEYNTLKVNLETALNDAVEAGTSLEQIVREFENGLIDDELNVWAEFKAYGFRIKHESLSVITNTTAASFDAQFADSMARLAEIMYREENSELTEYYDEILTTTDFGLHIIKVTKSGQFEKADAMFTENDPLYPVYSVGSVNEGVIPNESQIELFMEILVANYRDEQTDVSIPNTVRIALDRYYRPVYEIYLSNWSTSKQTLQSALDVVTTFTTNEETKLALITEQLENILRKDDFILEVE